MKNTNLTKIIAYFNKKWPKPETELKFANPFQLLIATILSAQTTDKQVNQVTKELFEKYGTLEMMAKLSTNDLAKKINSLGLYHNKSKYIVQTCKLLLEKYQGQIPRTRKELMSLAGVGRKTANVVLACAFAQNTFPVDTHVQRVARRLALSKAKKVEKLELELMDLIPENYWIKMHHWLIFHGREICKARKPLCHKCQIKDYCPSYETNIKR